MKKFLYSLLFALLLTVSVTMPLQARDLTWSKYNLNFAIPEGGALVMNMPTFFEYGWEDMHLTIQLYSQDKDNKDKNVYTSTLMRKAEGFSMYDLKKSKIRVKNFKSYCVEGIMPDGTRALLVNLVSKKSDLVVQIVVNYLYGNREVVDDMIKSFAENKQQQPNHEVKKQKIKKPDEQAREQIRKETELEKKRRQQREYDEMRRKGEIHDV